MFFIWLIKARQVLVLVYLFKLKKKGGSDPVTSLPRRDYNSILSIFYFQTLFIAGLEYKIFILQTTHIKTFYFLGQTIKQGIVWLRFLNKKKKIVNRSLNSNSPHKKN